MRVHLLFGLGKAVPNVSCVDAATRAKLHLTESSWLINERLVTLSQAAVLWMGETAIQDKAGSYLLRRIALHVTQGGS